MATEIRRITFTNRELIAAILAHCRAGWRDLPPGPVTVAEVDKEIGVTLSFETFNVQTDAKAVAQFKLDQNEVGAALLRYCMANRVPIPKSARKSLQVIGDSVSLMIMIDAPAASLSPPLEPV